MSATRKGPRGGAYHCVKAMALAVSLVFSALVMAVAVGLPNTSWLVWISILPLFVVIRSLRPSTAAFAGGFWGSCLYIFSVYGAASHVSPGPLSFALLITTPAIYAGFGSLLTRTIGFNPIMLALGWILVEIALRPAGLHKGLLGDAPSGGLWFDWIARVLGYVVVGFLVACANASLLAVLCKARLRIARQISLAGLSDSGRCSVAQTFICLRLFPLREVYPRAPPSLVCPT